LPKPSAKLALPRAAIGGGRSPDASAAFEQLRPAGRVIFAVDRTAALAAMKFILEVSFFGPTPDILWLT
jgi:hypothetical protein